MEEEIDLRPYVKALLKRWYWILIGVVLAVVVVIVFSFSLTPSYKSTALVVVVSSRDVIQFDERFRDMPENQPLRALPQLALSDGILQQLLDQVEMEEVETVSDLRGYLEAETGDDLTLVKLSVTAKDPALSARLANQWAALFVAWANEVFGEQGMGQIRIFETQLEEAEVALAAAEADLISFQGINRTQVLSNTLSAYSQTQADYLEAQRSAAFLQQDIVRMRSLVAEQTNNTDITLADQLTAFYLQLNAFNAVTAVPIQLQLDGESALVGVSQQEQLTLLDDLADVLITKQAQIDTELSDLEPKILQLQQEIEETMVEYDRLIVNREVAEGTYVALSRKLEEERIASADTTAGVVLASEASVPVDPVGFSKALYIILAIFVGGMVAVVIIFIYEWWKAGSEPESVDEQ